jgi:chemotaxis protein histidine kinase CheA
MTAKLCARSGADFHTLKGSGRMVGLLELGETAYSIEKVLNRWLDDERPAAPELLAVVREAERHSGAGSATCSRVAPCTSKTAR